MALLFASGMESGLVELTAGGGTLAVESTVKRSGNYALKWTPAFGFATMPVHAWTAAAATDEVIFGFGYAEATIYANEFSLVSVQLGASSFINLFRSPGGLLTVYRATSITGSVTSLGNCLLGPVVNTYKHIECRIKPHDSTGIVEVWVDGVRLLNLTNIDTLHSAAGTERAVVMGCLNTNTAYFVDDLIVMDSTGTVNNALVGPTKIERLAPTSDVAENWTKSSGADSFALVDEVPVSSADNITSNVATTKEEWGLANRTHTGQVLAVVATAVGVNSDGGAASVKLGVKSAATENQSAGKALGATTTHARHIVQVDPNTSALWLTAAVDAATLTAEVA